MKQFICHLETMRSFNGARRARNSNGDQKAQQTIWDFSHVVIILLPFQAFPDFISITLPNVTRICIPADPHQILDQLQIHVARQDKFLCLIPFHCCFPPWSSHRTVILILTHTSIFGRKMANSDSELQLGIWDRNSRFHLVHLFKVCLFNDENTTCQ